jgi:hypothetical protein
MLLVLALNVCFFGQQVLYELTPSIKEDNNDVRDTPQKLKSLLWILVSYVILVVGIMGVAELRFWYVSENAPLVTRVSLFAFGMFHLTLFLMMEAFFVFRRRIGSQQFDQLPTFRSPTAKSNPIIQTLNVAGVLLAIAGTFSFVKAIVATSQDWLLALKMAAAAVVVLWAVKVLLVRPAKRQMALAVTDLEENILLENLQGPEIRKLFEARLAGSKLNDWSRESSCLIADAYSSLGEFIENAEQEIAVLCALEFGAEKLTRIDELERHLKAKLAEFDKRFESIVLREGSLFATNIFFANTSLKQALRAVLDKKKQMEAVSSSIQRMLHRLEKERQRTQEVSFFPGPTECPYCTLN